MSHRDDEGFRLFLDDAEEPDGDGPSESTLDEMDAAHQVGYDAGRRDVLIEMRDYIDMRLRLCDLDTGPDDAA